MTEDYFPEVANLDYRFDLASHKHEHRKSEYEQEPEEREVMAQIIGEEPDETSSIADMEYNFLRERGEKWHP